jgi:long-chain acyl-CoA synthetase
MRTQPDGADTRHMTTVAPAPISPVLDGGPAPPAAHPTLCAAFLATAAADPSRVALRAPGGSTTITWGEYARRARATGARLAALGVRRGDAVVLLLSTRPEASCADAGAMLLGAVGVSLYVAAPPATHAHVVEDVGAAVLVTERALAARAAGLRRACPSLRHVVSIDGEAAGIPALDELEEASGFDADAAARDTHPDDPVTIMYTSGTTGPPKGVVHSHGRLARTFAILDAALPPLAELSGIAHIPFAHAGQRAMGHYRTMLRPSTTTFCANPADLPATIADAHPTYLFAPPGSWQRILDAVDAAIDADPEETRRVATRDALARGFERMRTRAASSPPPEDARMLAALRERTGLDRLGQPMSCAAPPPRGLLERLHALGLPMIELYAASELPPITATRPDPADIGTVGRAIPGVQVRLAPDGEILVRHAAASLGYHRRPAQTAALFDEDGWMRTGDLGAIDGLHRLRLTGRSAERMISSFGHNIDPARIELGIRAQSPLVDQVCVVGDGRPHLVALVTLRPGAAASDPVVRDAVRAAVVRANAGVAQPGHVRRILLLADTWAPGGDELTPTLKLRRRGVHARYATEIEALYACAPETLEVPPAEPAAVQP